MLNSDYPKSNFNQSFPIKRRRSTVSIRQGSGVFPKLISSMKLDATTLLREVAFTLDPIQRPLRIRIFHATYTSRSILRSLSFGPTNCFYSRPLPFRLSKLHHFLETSPSPEIRSRVNRSAVRVTRSFLAEQRSRGSAVLLEDEAIRIAIPRRASYARSRGTVSVYVELRGSGSSESASGTTARISVVPRAGTIDARDV